ncbi:response regulator [Vibrio maerlii]|uniref:response regulator n=1 Tax=Vibrio maerlii TaxID=2231648 RepID=UPI001F128F80|nr:response regulator [Vibrio maerlii]
MYQGYRLAKADSPYKDLSVLIVDDFEAVTRILYNAFEEMGFKTIHKAKDGKEAIIRLENQLVDIIVSDWKMPKMDGMQLLKYTRRDDYYKSIPFIMLTGNIHQGDVIEAIEAGVSEYLIKPFSKADLADRVHKAFVSPIPKSAISRLRHERAEKQKSEERTILIVDDEPNNLQVLGELLKDRYKVKVCRSGAKALEICAQIDQPDLILLDIMMPEMDGLEVCRALKADPDTEFIPIIFVSALSETKDVVKGLELGAQDYISKPIIPEIVNARVDTHIRAVIQREKMNQQMDALVNAARVHEDVATTFHHDLRNPLTAMLSTIPLIQLDEQYNEELDIVHELSEIMMNMIKNHDIMASLERGDYNEELKEVTSNDILAKVAASFKALSQKKNINIEMDVDPSHIYMGDEMLSFTMYSNLIKNAIEASPMDSRVLVKSARIENEIVISIFNFGEVPINIRGQFFDKFVTNGKLDGMGIGAYSAKLCTEAQGGKIKLNNKDGVGTTLTVRFMAGEQMPSEHDFKG